MNPLPKKILCSGGPLDGKTADSRLGSVWPAAIAVNYRPYDILLGYYRLIDGIYIWDSESVEPMNMDKYTHALVDTIEV